MVAWNAGVVAGSAMLMDSAPRETRAWAEGFGETAMGTAAAIGAPVAGVVAAAGGFATLTAAAAGIAVLTIIVFGSLVISSTKPIA